MRGRVRIAVIGCINRDTVRRPGMPPIRGLGGILYNIFGLSRLLGDSARILPVCNIGRDVAEPVSGLLSRLRNVDTTNVRIVSTVNNHCRMSYLSDDERSEVFTGFVPAISPRQLMKVRDCDIALINFISGRDLTLNALRDFRGLFRGTIYMDFHTLSMGLRRDGSRFLRKPRRWSEYVGLCDYLQMNSTEFGLLSGFPPARKPLLRFFGENVEPDGIAMMVTLGRDGAVAVSGRRGELVVHRRRPPKLLESADTTGAGDLFAAGFCAKLTAAGSIAGCLETAVGTGTYGCSIIHPEDIRLPQIR